MIDHDDDGANHDDNNAARRSPLSKKIGAVAPKVVPKKPKRPMSVAVVGATGVVGRETLSILQERRFPLANLQAFASDRSAGESIELGDLDADGEGKSLAVQSIESADFKGVDLVFFAASGGVSKLWAPRAAAAGAVCIDKSSSFRMDDDVPLVVPEVNGATLKDFSKKRIVATPNCSTIQLVQLLAPLQRAVGIERVVVCTYQAVSGAGRGGVDELEAQTRDLFSFKDALPKVFDQQIAFNVLPRIPAREAISKDGTTGEERKMIEETRKILGVADLRIDVTCVRVPVFNAHSEAVYVELKEPLSAEQAKTLFALEPNVLVVDDAAAGVYPTALDATGEDKTLVGRIRNDESVPGGRGLAFWVVSDNLRTGAALNAVRIAEALCADFF